MSYICKADHHHHQPKPSLEANVNLPSLNPAEPWCRPSAHRRLQFYLRGLRTYPACVRGEVGSPLSAVGYPIPLYRLPHPTRNSGLDWDGFVSAADPRVGALHREASEGPGSAGTGSQALKVILERGWGSRATSSQSEASESPLEQSEHSVCPVLLPRLRGVAISAHQ